MIYQGSCHCGRIAFNVDGEIQGALACNCSMCQRKGSLLWFVPRARFTLNTPEDDNLGTYLFHRHAIRHRFCKTCGIHPFAEATDPQGQPTMAVNIRCLEGIDLEAVPVQHYDGRSR